jgi:hypothetical protein
MTQYARKEKWLAIETGPSAAPTTMSPTMLLPLSPAGAPINWRRIRIPLIWCVWGGEVITPGMCQYAYCIVLRVIESHVQRLEVDLG